MTTSPLEHKFGEIPITADRVKRWDVTVGIENMKNEVGKLTGGKNIRDKPSSTKKSPISKMLTV